jgi:hypothetical protein
LSPEETVDVNGAITWRGSLNTGKTSAGALDRSGNELRIRAYGATAGTGQLVFRTGGGGGSVDSEAMRIDSSQRVGIGTSAPAYALHVSTTSVPAIGAFRALDVASVGTAGQEIYFGALNGSTPTPGASITGRLDNPATTGDLAFSTRSGGTLNTRMFISSGGNVGIGTATPAYTLVAKGGVATTGIVSSIINPVSGGNSKIHNTASYPCNLRRNGRDWHYCYNTIRSFNVCQELLPYTLTPQAT